MTKRTLTIGEISKILNVPASTLRFWEEQGLFHISKSSNQYRTYTTTDLIQIADILFYRNLGIPIKRVKDFSAVPLPEYGDLLQSLRHQLTDMIHSYELMYEKTCMQQQCYYSLLQLMVNPFIVEDVPFQKVVSWDFLEKDKIMRYVDDPTCYVWCKDTASDEPGKKGMIFADEFDTGDSPLIWSRKGHTSFLTFPIKAIVGNDFEGLEAEQIIAQVQQHYRTGYLLSRHLLTCTEENQPVEYLKGYLEILDPINENINKTLKLP